MAMRRIFCTVFNSILYLKMFHFDATVNVFTNYFSFTISYVKWSRQVSTVSTTLNFESLSMYKMVIEL